MIRTSILLCSLIFYAAGCSSTRTTTSTSRQNGEGSAWIATGKHAEQRVEGQFAHEAGMHEQRWALGKTVSVPPQEEEAITPLAITQERGQGGLGPVLPGQISINEACGLEVVDQAEIELRKEEMVVGKREVSNGGVLIRKVVQTEKVSQPIDLRREEYVLERVPASQAGQSRATGIGTAFQGREIYLPLTAEEAVVGKRVLLSENVRFGKSTATDRQIVSAQVRTEDVELTNNPDLSNARFSAVPRKPASGSIKGVVPPDIPASMTPDQKLALAHEQLTVGKAEVEHGGVYLRKIIRTETASQPVELKREEFVMERSPLGNQPVSGADFQPREIRLNLSREEAVIGTRNYPAEYVRLRKQVHTDTQTVSAEVRKENLEVVQLTDSSLVGQGGTATESRTVITSESGSSKTVTCEKDQAINDRVQKALSDGSFGKKYSVISVTTHDGKVTLAGMVGSEKEKARIGKAVAKMSGVRGVKNELTTNR